MKKALIVPVIICFLCIGYNTSLAIQDEPNTDVRISVYPNPAADFLNIEFDDPVQNSSKIRILNLFGDEVLKEEITANEFLTKKRLNLSHLPKGVYFLKIKIQDKEITKRVVLQ